MQTEENKYVHFPQLRAMQAEKEPGLSLLSIEDPSQQRTETTCQGPQVKNPSTGKTAMTEASRTERSPVHKGWKKDWGTRLLVGSATFDGKVLDLVRDERSL